MAESFASRLGPATIDGGFRMDDYWVWCGSVIQGEDGNYHMFASRWPKSFPFSPFWLTNSEIVRASSPTPEGPYTFEEVVLPPRGAEYWDGRMTHNPAIVKVNDTYVLFYTGTTYEEPMPVPGDDSISNKTLVSGEMKNRARANQRIGIATAPSVRGPWQRRDEPVLLPREGRWDGLMTTNAAPCVKPDGSILLIYKSSADQKDLLRMGAAASAAIDGPYDRLAEEPIFSFDEPTEHVEDGFVWWSGDNNRYEMIMKDMNGGICGEKQAGIFAYSQDGIHWDIADSPLAYSRTVVWTDGTVTTQGRLERPQLLLENGSPTHLFAATSDCSVRIMADSRTWNMVIPLTTIERTAE